MLQAEERIFSHSNVYERARLNQSLNDQSDKQTVYSINSLLGETKPRLVYGLLTTREDGHFYLEDNSFSMKVSFNELQFVEPDAFFTE